MIDFGQLTRGITLITGTDTGVGKTVATAVAAAWLARRGADVVACKPVQSGAGPADEGDIGAVGRLSGLPAERLLEWSRLEEPLAPTVAASRAGVPLPGIDEVARRIVRLTATHTVLVEGAGGILVGLDGEGRGLLELADALAHAGHRPRFVVVTRPGLGTLNHTGLTVAVIRSRGHDVAGLVIGSWPAVPSLAEACNTSDLAGIAPLLANLPEGLGRDPRAVARLAEEAA